MPLQASAEPVVAYVAWISAAVFGEVHDLADGAAIGGAVVGLGCYGRGSFRRYRRRRG